MILLKKILIIVLCLANLATNAQKLSTETYSNQWAEAEKLIEEQLPASALKVLNDIYLKATKNNNETQALKAKMNIFNVEVSKNAERTNVLMQEFEMYIAKINDKTLQAIAFNLLAEMYFQTFENSSWQISERTHLENLLPADSNEWSQQHFSEKVGQCLQKSFENPHLLMQNQALKYNALLLEGDDSRTLQPTVYDLLLQRTLNFLQANLFENQNTKSIDVKVFAPAAEFIKYVENENAQNNIRLWAMQLVANRLKHLNANEQAFVHTDLKRLNFASAIANDDQAFAQALNHLAAKHADNPFVVEVVAQQVDILLGSNKTTDTAKAYELIVETIKKHPNYKRIAVLENSLQRIKQPVLQLHNNDIVARNKGLQLNITHKNIEKIKISLYKVTDDVLAFHTFVSTRNAEEKHLNRTFVKTYAFALHQKVPFENATTEIVMPTPDFGIFEMEVIDAATDKVLTKQMYRVSDLSFMSSKNNENTLQVHVLHRMSGQPLANALVSVYTNAWTGKGYELRLEGERKTNKDGFVVFETLNNRGNHVFFVSNGADKAFSTNNYAHYYRHRSFENLAQEKINIFTDRAIYRPGQMIYFKAIAYSFAPNANEVLPNRKLDVQLIDANNKVLSTQSLITNEFGSVAGEFVLPNDLLNGNFNLRIDKTMHSVLVEEYKRPLFEVTVEKPEAEVRFGQNIKLKGKAIAYAGYSIAHAKVMYRWQRMRHPYAFWLPNQSFWLDAAQTTTDADGAFEINFAPEKPNEKDFFTRFGAYFNYQLTVDVTDIKGETQSTTQNITVGDKALFIVADIPQKALKNNVLKFDVNAETLNGIAIKQMLQYAIYQLPTDDFVENQPIDSLKVGAQVMHGQIMAGNEKLLVDARKWKSGLYRIEFSTTDKFDKEVKMSYNIVLYASNECKPPLKTYLWLQHDKAELSVGEKATIVVGSSAKNAWVLYELFEGQKQVEKKWLRLSNRSKKIQIIFSQEMTEGATLRISMLHDEKLFAQSIVLTEKLPNKKLTPSLSIFRDKLKPGDTEVWTANILETKNKKAELLTVMYDASLDAIANHSWNFVPMYRRPAIFVNNWNATMFERDFAQAAFEMNLKEEKNFKFDALLPLQIQNYAIRMTGRYLLRGSALAKNEMKTSAMPVFSESLNVVEDAVEETETTDATNNSNVADLRSNFAETAFFYPQLKTDADGNVKIEFLAPQSLTRWNVKMLAHTQDLFAGYAENSVITQKELMLNMHLPRFIRQSDTWTFAASVVNMTDSTLHVQVLPQVFDPRTENSIDNTLLQAKSIVLLPLSSQNVAWEMPHIKNVDLLVCKMTAKTKVFSDGEQRYLPVLPDKVLVTESMPMLLRSNQTKTFVFESMNKQFDAVDNKAFTVEFTANPVWLALQTLPALNALTGNNSIDLTSRFYASQMAHNIVSENPEITQQLQLWLNDAQANESLQSTLEKNEDLKNTVLEETPWLVAAQNESEQMRKVVDLLNENRQVNVKNQLLDRLLKNQTETGGFTWLPSMQPSLYVTLEFLFQMGNLQLKADNTTETSALLIDAIAKAMLYVDVEMKRKYDDLKSKKKLDTMTSDAEIIKYLYIRVMFQQLNIDENCAEAYAFYLNKSLAQWKKQSLYSKAMLVVVARHNHQAALANEMLKSLHEQAIQSADKGMYWAANKAGYFWNERPVIIQAALIKAFSTHAAYATDVEEMKAWLLMQKQTQMWDSPIASVNAVAALTQNSSNWFAKSNKVKLTVGNNLITHTSQSNDLGYFKTQILAPNIKPEMSKIELSSQNEGTKTLSWGAAYWQYMVSPDMMQKSGSQLHVTKQMFVLQTQKTGAPTLQALKNTTVRKGDRIVTRLVVTADRNFEFVALNDHRAACLEPIDRLSGMQWKQGLGYYQSTKDAATVMYFDELPQGTYVFEYETVVAQTGNFDGGRASLQCLYAPEFVAHCGSEKILVID